jgi:murein L,D-transpeptidase YcbB/YkuD
MGIKKPISILTTSALAATFCLLFACMEQNAEPRTVAKVDTTITPQNAYLNLFLDSSDVLNFLAKAGLPSDDSLSISNFYKERNYQFAWFDTAGLAEQAMGFINLYQNYALSVNDTTLKNEKLEETISNIADDSSFLKDNNNIIIPTELKLTQQFFKYAEKAYEGDNAIKPEDVGWFIPRKKLDVKLFLDSLVANKGKGINAYEPSHPLFGRLTEALKKYSLIEKNGGWQPIMLSKKTYKIGDSSAEIGLLKSRLAITDDLPTGDSGNVFTESTKQGIANFQHRYGLKEDGVLNQSLVNEMNVPVGDRIKQILINLERIRWVPKPGNGRYIVVNIPAFKLYVYDSSRLQWDMVVVTGSAANSTVIFSGEISTIAFSPYWNVPYSIVKKEMAGKSASYFARNNMEIVGKYSNGVPMVRQKPGPTNSLGKVKFLFPNSYSIYLHDTPSKGVFERNNRAASHGCVRLQEPIKMAQYLLDYDPKWTLDSINKSTRLPKEKQVKLERKVPVFIGYFTAWVDNDGKLNFRKDVYGHDAEMAKRLFTAQSLNPTAD